MPRSWWSYESRPTGKEMNLALLIPALVFSYIFVGALVGRLMLWSDNKFDWDIYCGDESLVVLTVVFWPLWIVGMITVGICLVTWSIIRVIIGI